MVLILDNEMTPPRGLAANPTAAQGHDPAERPAHDRRSPEAAAHTEAVEGSTPHQARRPDQAHDTARHRDRAAERHSEVETTLKRKSP